LLIETSCSLVSAGTERMLVDFGKAGWLGKARKQPEKVRQVLAKIRADGALVTLRAIRAKLAQPIPLGYCQVGRVLAAGDGSKAGHESGFSEGERVVSNGPHAEVVSVDQALCCRIPDGVTDEEAAFTPLAAIALEGIDLLAAAPGEKVVVTGLGLIGQLAVRILVARGCEVLGLDPSRERRALAEKAGATTVAAGVDPVSAMLAWSEGHGVAGVLITASASSNEIVNQAARGCRRRGRVVLVGVVGLLLNRADFYRNEVSFQVSNSYGLREGTGPGSVRANFTAVLDLMAGRRLSVADLITHRHRFAEAATAYAALGDPHALGIVMHYAPGPRTGVASWPRTLPVHVQAAGKGVALVGAGNFAVRTLLPAIAGLEQPPRIAAVASTQGAAAWLAARDFGAARATTDVAEVIGDPAIETVFLTTRHDAHARQATDALRAGKNVWIEKPLALRTEDVSPLVTLAAESRRVLMVGFNRRFSPLATKLRAHLREREGKFRMRAVINAGQLPADHWTLDPRKGGGRIVGEACHWLDLLRFFAGSPVARVKCSRRDRDGQDGACFELEFTNGAVGIVDYRTDLPAHVPKEAITVEGEGWSARIDNWKRLTTEGMGGLRAGSRWSGAQQKGHPEALALFFGACKDGGSPIPLDEVAEVSRLAIALQAMQAGEELRSLA
jgi:predicted dehydrogenase